MAFTRDSSTSRLLCTNQSSLHCPPPACIAHTIAILLHDCCAMYDPPPTLLLYAIHHTILVMAVSCKKINRSHIHTHTHTHTHTDREQHPRHRHRHAHDKNNTPNPQTNTSHKHLTTLEVGATTVRATSHARAVSCQRRGELAFIRYCFT